MASKIQVKLIMQLRATGMSQTTIARERHMSKSSVNDGGCGQNPGLFKEDV